MSKHYGNLEVFGYIKVGQNTDGGYQFPILVGEDGEFIGIENGEAVFKRVGSTVDIVEISGGQQIVDDVSYLMSISGASNQFEEMIDTPAVGEADLHAGEVLIVNPNAATETEKISYSGINISELTEGAVTSINTESPDSSGSIDFVSDGTIDIIPNGDGTIQLSLYVSISNSLSISNVLINGNASPISTSSIERGMEILETNLSWNHYTKPPVSQSLNQGIGSISLGTTSHNHISTYTSNRAYTLTYADSNTTKNSNAGITFRDLRFWGEFTSNNNLIESDIKANSKELSTGRNKSITFSPNGKRIYYSYPVSFGLATVKDANGLTFQSWYDNGSEVTSPYVVSITNNYGHTQDYYVYQSFNTFGASSIKFTWA